MSIQLSDLWQRTLELLKNELTEISFNTWIKTIEPISINSNSINFGVPAEFNKGILESRYLFTHSKYCQTSDVKRISLIFVTPSQEK